MAEIKTECSSCGGTGVYCGFAEPKGTGVVCLSCNGSGCKTISYTPFTGRNLKSNVQYVSRSRGSFILACGPTGGKIAYSDFCNGKMP